MIMNSSFQMAAIVLSAVVLVSGFAYACDSKDVDAIGLQSAEPVVDSTVKTIHGPGRDRDSATEETC